MCTVTFIPIEGRVYLVSNRDEKHLRKDAIPPKVYSSPSGKLLYPQDAEAKGTWIVLHENGNALVLLNGGREPHSVMPVYRRSRGQVLLDLAKSDLPTSLFLSIDLEYIEPFTLVCLEKGKLWEAVWDGENRQITKKDEKSPHIWSSVTLYDHPARLRREEWFRNWLENNWSPSLRSILHFHQFTGDGDPHNDLLMNRDGNLYTVSITGMEIDEEKGAMIYNDLRNNQLSESGLSFNISRAAR